MSPLRKHWGPATLGIAVAVGAAVWFGLGWSWWGGIPAALIAAAVAAVVLSPDPKTKRNAAIPEAFREEFLAAEQRVKTVRGLAMRQGLTPVRDPLRQIADHAKAILDDVRRSPGDYRRMRKVLTHYFAHVETIAERLDYVTKTGTAEPDMIERGKTTLTDLVAVFAGYREKATEDEKFDIDARMTLLEQEIKGHAATMEQVRERTMGSS